MKVKDAIKHMDECKVLIKKLEEKIKEFDSRNPNNFDMDFEAVALSLRDAYDLIDICQDYSYLLSMQQVEMQTKEDKLPF